MVELESPSGDAVRAVALAAELARELALAGAEPRPLAAPGFGHHVEAHLPGTRPDLPPLLLLGHMDTVFPAGTLAQRPFGIVDGRVLGPGVYDMKAGLAVVLEALRQLREGGHAPLRPLRILLTCDEEVGSPSARAHIERLAGGAGAALVLAPCLPGGAAQTARKGVAAYTLRVQGLAAHAGIEPDRGVSAVRELAHQILAAQALARPARGTVVTIGMIGGGTADNVVPASAWATLDVRFTTAAEARRVDRRLRALRPVLPRAQLRLEGGISRPPLPRTRAGAALFRRARALAAGIGFTLEQGSTGGASDGNLTAAAGVPTLDGLGPDGGGAHAAHEHVRLDDLSRRVALLRALLTGL